MIDLREESAARVPNINLNIMLIKSNEIAAGSGEASCFLGNPFTSAGKDTPSNFDDGFPRDYAVRL